MIARRRLQLLARVFQLLALLLIGQLQLFKQQISTGQLFAQLQDGRVLRVGSQQRQLFAKAALPLGQAFHRLLELLDARLQHFGLAPRLGRASVEAVPLLLPAMHGQF